MNTPRINPILLIDLLIATDEERARLDPHLRTIEQDPASTVSVLRLDQQIALAAEDELQLEMACHHLAESAPIHFGELRIAYRETIRRAAEGEGKYIRQTGGSGNYGHCWLRVEPNERDRGNEFFDKTTNGVIPAAFLRPIKQGVQAAMAAGILAGHPMIDVRTTLVDGSYHEIDSNDMAFRFAAASAFKQAATKAAPVLLEPAMSIEVEIPEDLAGAIIADINSRRGRIEKMDVADGWSEVEAIVPLAEVLRSSPHGRPDYSGHFSGYQEVPRPNDHGDGGIPVPSLRPRDPRPSRSSAINPEPNE